MPPKTISAFPDGQLEENAAGEPQSSEPNQMLSDVGLDVQHASKDDLVQWKAGHQELVILATMSVLSIVIALDATILVPALTTLAEDLNGTAIETFWTGTSYLLSNAVFVPIIGIASEITGRRAAVLFALVAFSVGTVVCCTASGMTQLLVGRTIQGIGGSGIFVMASIIITDIVPLRQRPKYQGLISASWGLGAIFGPLLGGQIIQHTTWKWLFYVNFPFCGIGFIMLPFFKLQLIQKRSFRRNIARIDWAGGLLFMAAMTSLLLGITWGGVQFSWSSYKTWLPILLGGLAIVADLIYESRIPQEPFIKVSVFHDISSSVTFFLTMVQGLIMYAELYYIPYFLMAVKEESPSIAGIIIMAVNIITFPASIVAGLIMTRQGTFVWVIRIGFCIMTLGTALFANIQHHTSMVSQAFIYLVSGFALGFLLPSLETATQAMAKPGSLTHATSTYIFMRSFGLCIGVAVGGTIFSNLFLQALLRRHVPDAQSIAANSEAFANMLKSLPSSDGKTLILKSYVEGFHGVFYLLTALSAISLLLSFFIRHHSMDQKLQSGHRIDRGDPDTLKELPADS